MFLNTLTISSGAEVIREINFRKGINLIIDESDGKITGNGVGKTTVLKLIDFCFGAEAKVIYEDPESKKRINKLVKDYLVQNKVLITLSLIGNLDDTSSDEILIERNFASGKKSVIRRINGINYNNDEFVSGLKNTFFPENKEQKPTFRQIISHNIRYKELSIVNTIKRLNSYTSNAEYETLNLFLLGLEHDQGTRKQKVLDQIKQENSFKKRLEKVQTKSAYEAALSLINADLIKLNKEKEKLKINKDLENDLKALNEIKYFINTTSTGLNNLKIRKQIIEEANKELLASKSDIDEQQLQAIYKQATDKLGELHKTFEQLVDYHNKMLDEKVQFIMKELPELERKIKAKEDQLKDILVQEKILSEKVSKSNSFEDLEKLIESLAEKNQKKGEYESIIKQIQDAENSLQTFNNELEAIDDELFSDEFEKKLKGQVDKFNKYFAEISSRLYSERYALKYDKVTNRQGQSLYEFNTFNTNFSSGKKQGEISCFDIAYSLFADAEGIPNMHFLLNDKKELMHGNQLMKIAEVVSENSLQFVASILKDKLPENLNKEEYFILELSEDEKLFRIENNN